MSATLKSPSNESSSGSNSEADVDEKNETDQDNKIRPGIQAPPSLHTDNDNEDNDEDGSSDYDSDSDSDYDDDGNHRPKTPAHNLRNNEADDWTHDELDQMQTGMIMELSRLLSTADVNDPVLDQLNMAVVTPRAGPMGGGHHKTSTMDSIFSFMSNESETKDDRNMSFFAMSDPNLDNINGNVNAPLVPSSKFDPNMNNHNPAMMNNGFGHAGSGTHSPQKGTMDYQNRAKMEVDKTIEKISSSVDEVISKLEKDKIMFSKSKDKNGKKVLSKKNKDVLDKLTKYQESLMVIHDSLEDFERMIDEFEMDTVLHKQQFEYNIKNHYETKYETERQIMELELQNANENLYEAKAKSKNSDDWKAKERLKFGVKLKEEMKLYKKSIKEQYRVRVRNLQKKLKLNEEKKRKEYKEKIMASFELIVRERIRKMEDEKKLRQKLLQKQDTKARLKTLNDEKDAKKKINKKRKKRKSKGFKRETKTISLNNNNNNTNKNNKYIV